MHFGRPWVDWGSMFVTLLGLVGIVLLWRAGPLVMPEPRPWFGSGRSVDDPGGDREGDGDGDGEGGDHVDGADVDAADPVATSGDDAVV